MLSMWKKTTQCTKKDSDFDMANSSEYDGHEITGQHVLSFIKTYVQNAYL